MSELSPKAVRMTEAAVVNLAPNVELLAVAGPIHSGPPWDEDGEEAEFLLQRYRVRTVKILRRYFRLQVEAGRLQSVMSQTEARARISSYKLRTFEDAVIFVHDVERCLLELDPFLQKLIVLAVLQEHSPQTVAQVMHCGSRTVERRVPEALDEMTRRLLEKGILPYSPPERKVRGRAVYFPITTSIAWRGAVQFGNVPGSCQEGRSNSFPSSAYKESK